MTLSGLSRLRRYYKIYWGIIHQESIVEIMESTQLSYHGILRAIRHFPELKLKRYSVKRAPSRKEKERRYHYKISDECLMGLQGEGFSQAEIANTCGCSRQAISLRFKHRGLMPGNVKTLGRKAKAYWYKIQGFKLEEIQRRTGLSRTAISMFPELRIAKGSKCGGPMGPRRKTQWRITDCLPWHTKVYWCSIQGMQVHDIAKHAGVSEAAIYIFRSHHRELRGNRK